MIADTLQNVITEVNGLWNWTLGIIAGWGLSFTIVVVALIIAYIRIRRLNAKVDSLKNQLVTDTRELSLRITKIEKSK